MPRSELTQLQDNARPIGVTVNMGRLWVELEDGRLIATPLDWYMSLVNATPEELSNTILLRDSIHWPDLDEDLSIGGMLMGVRPHYPWTAEEWRARADSIKSLIDHYGDEATMRFPIQMTDPLDASVTVKEIAGDYGLSTDAVYQAIRRKRLPAERSGATWLIRRRDAESLWGKPPQPYREENKVQPSPE
jgi:excisionase family DNA binding protein